ncbi:DNA repair protein [candidate division KSB1 bacterium]|nr:DNA repair protein [candidate division KSB1 bacterium]
MKKIQLLTLTLGHEKYFRRDIPKIRGYFGRQFPQYIQLHHHIESNKFIYAYPLVQYKVLNYTPTIVGINSGADVLKQIQFSISEMKIADAVIPITEKSITVSEQKFGLDKELHFYKFVSPWLALNQKNYHSYRNADYHGKFDLLNRILVGNLLSMSKAMEYTVPDRIEITNDTRLKPVKLKGMDMSGFSGLFACNFIIPDNMGIGKSVARGFGTVKQISIEDVGKYY